jgi:DNA-binding transcriptional LysR family regulator
MIAMNISERSPIDGDLLRTFLAVAEAGNVTRAAARLGRTQSAISVQLRKLEGVLSVRLFDRQARGMTLTEDGELLVPAAADALNALERIGGLFSAPLVGRLRVGIPDDYGVAALERVLAAFAARHPAVEVSVRCGFSAGFPEAIRKNELDIAVYAADRGTRDEDILFTERTAWAASTTFSLTSDAPAPLALFDRTCWWRDAAIEAMARANRSYRIAYSSESVAGVKAAISAGQAIGILAESTLDDTMRIMTEQEGLPLLPPSSLLLLRSNAASCDLVHAMENALRAAFLPAQHA